jgi:low temperature requirement protein LtrA
MREPGGERLVPEEASWQRASFLELFFDLVFVFALSQVSLRLTNEFNTEHRLLFSEAAPTFLLFLALWMMWLSTVALTSRLHPDSALGQLTVFMSMAGAVVMAVSVAQGFEQRALVFAVAYVATWIGRMLLFLFLRGPLNQRAPIPVLLPIFASAVPWIVGALVGDLLVRGLLWALALALDSAGFALGFRRTADGQLAGEHLAERFQQFFMITLGEAVFVSGRAFSNSNVGTPNGPAFGLAFVTTVLLWRIYFYRAGLALAGAITRARNPLRQSVALAGSHLLMIAGVFLAGVGFDIYITDPLGQPRLHIAVLGGPALFLLGRALLELQVFGRVSPSRLAGLLALGLLVPATRHLPPLGAGAAAAVVLAGIAGWDAWRGWGHPPELPAPRI